MYIPVKHIADVKLIGGLESTSKMPCASWSLPAMECGVGGQLNLVPGSVCNGCYALKGQYRMPNTITANYRRLERLHWALRGPRNRERFIQAMVRSIEYAATKSGGYFRMHASGDLQSWEHLELVCEVASRTEVKIWMPTKEYALVWRADRAGIIPENLIIRPSAPMVDGPAPKIGSLPTSTVHSSKAAQGTACIAPTQEGHCLDCRECWNPDTANISYHLH